MENTSFFNYGTEKLTTGLAIEIVAGKRKGILNKEVTEQIRKSRRTVEQIVHENITVYGINTGFGPLCTTIISEEDTRKLQHNILKSHSVGVGEDIPEEIALLMMILKVHSLAQGYSGISLKTLERIIWHIDNKVIPCVPSQGSVALDGSDFTGIRSYMGESRGHWEGDTLVVETRNFNDAVSYRGSGPDLVLTERYTLASPDTIDFRMTLEDDVAWTRPWTVAYQMHPTEGHLYEYACHEGNRGLQNILENIYDAADATQSGG